ncbi:MAG: Mut7-C RNAse domain-containing protein [Methanothrix sp.]
MQHFLVDLMLMRLGRWLRLLGQDVARPEGESDAQLLKQAKKECRTIITRDKRLFQACPGAGVQCVLIRSSAISDQLLEMAEAGVPLRLDPQRCTLCNGLLEEMEMLGMKRWQCRACKKLYWEGGHWQRMEKTLQAIRCRREENAERTGGAKAT